MLTVFRFGRFGLAAILGLLLALWFIGSSPNQKAPQPGPDAAQADTRPLSRGSMTHLPTLPPPPRLMPLLRFRGESDEQLAYRRQIIEDFEAWVTRYGVSPSQERHVLAILLDFQANERATMRAAVNAAAALPDSEEGDFFELWRDPVKEFARDARYQLGRVLTSTQFRGLETTVGPYFSRIQGVAFIEGTPHSGFRAEL